MDNSLLCGCPMHYRIVSIPGFSAANATRVSIHCKYVSTLADAPWGGSIASGFTSIVEETDQLSVTISVFENNFDRLCLNCVSTPGPITVFGMIGQCISYPLLHSKLL